MSKQVVTTTVASVPAAPANPAGVGHNVPGGHTLTWRALHRTGGFLPTATLRLVNPAHCPWSAKHSVAFYHKVLLDPQCKTVANAITLAKAKLNQSAKVVQSQLTYLYTWGPYLEVNGKLYNPSAPLLHTGAAPVVEKSKAKAS